MNLKKIVLAASLAVASLTAGAAPVQWGVNGHYYEFIATGVNWDTARGNALGNNYLGMAGYLATVTSLAEQNFLFGTVTQSVAWIGGSDEWNPAGEDDQNVWKWMDGPEAGQIFWNNGAVGGMFSFWNAGEPNNCCGGEDYLQINWNGSTGQWNDHGGPGNPGQVNGFIVEYSGSVPEPGSLLLAGLGLAGLGLGRRRRKSASN